MIRRRATAALLGPYLVLTAVFFVYPLIQAAALALQQTNGPRSRVFVGAANFTWLARDPDFRRALGNTAVFAVCSLLLQLPLSLGLALLLEKSGRARGVLRLVFFAPNLVGQIFVGILFGVLFAPRYGLVNRTLHAAVGWGLEARWTESPALAMPALVLTSLWMYVGWNALYFAAALQSVDRALIEAAMLDGANRWQVFRHVTLPAIRPVTTFVVIMSLIGSFQLFELPLALFFGSNGYGPNGSGLTVMTYLNDVAFNRGDLGLGSAIGWTLTAIVFALSVVHLRMAARRSGGLS